MKRINDVIQFVRKNQLITFHESAELDPGAS